MRWILAALALAGALSFVSPSAAGDRYPTMAQGANASDVTRAKRCAPPFGCKRVKRKAPKADYRSSIAATVDAVAHAEGVPARLAWALVKVESGGNPNKRGREGEWGLTQIKCQTARGLGFAGSCAGLANPATNLKWGLKHARRALERGSIGFHQAGLHARRVSRGYVARVHAAMR